MRYFILIIALIGAHTSAAHAANDALKVPQVSAKARFDPSAVAKAEKTMASDAHFNRASPEADVLHQNITTKGRFEALEQPKQPENNTLPALPKATKSAPVKAHSKPKKTAPHRPEKDDEDDEDDESERQ